MAWIIRSGESDSISELGGKAGALARLYDMGLPIPQWIVITPAAFKASLDPEQRQRLHAAQDATELRDLVADLRPSAAVEARLREELEVLCPRGELVAVRSSGIEEDGAEASFAGQFESFLCVAPARVPQKVAEVWRSAFSERSLAYRREHGLGPVPRPPAVLIQRMVEADVAGVAFSADPTTGRRDVAVIAGVHGLGTALVSGETDADTYHIGAAGRIISQAITEKSIAHQPAPDSDSGVRAISLAPQQAQQPALSEDQVRAIADLARRVERHFGQPQDIEWAIEDGTLHLLQARPITSLPRATSLGNQYNLWDNSNIAESYPGVTTPLTFSFIRRAYDEAYRVAFRVLGVRQGSIEANADVFAGLLGLIQGQVYYNLLNWYKLIALLPGYKLNRRFMEQMMGVRESLPEIASIVPDHVTRREQIADGLHLLLAGSGLIRNYFLLPRRIRRFYAHLNNALGPTTPDLSEHQPEQLVDYYLHLERNILTRWDAPLVNDLFAMIFYGLLRRLTAAWCEGDGGSLHNDLLLGEGGMISAEPAARVRAMAELAATDPALAAALVEGSLPDIQRAIERTPEFAAQYRSYLELFGDRCLEELKLESSTLRDDPVPLLRAIGQLARSPQRQSASSAAELRRKAEQRVDTALGHHPIRRAVFGWVLRNARSRVRDRENLRFERTRVFGRVRHIFLQIGRQFHGLDVLEDPQDIFYLELHEVFNFVHGKATTTDLKGLTALRKAEFVRYRALEAPPDRFETHGGVYQPNTYRRDLSKRGDAMQGEMAGLGCCPGVVCGPVRVVTDPRAAQLQPGEILVAQRTDPGWIMLFPAAAGLVVEHGSLLSHSAIVAREIGLPAVVSAHGVTQRLKDGDWVELDGSRGTVRLVPSPVAEVATSA